MSPKTVARGRSGTGSLGRLEQVRAEFNSDSGARKLVELRELERTELRGARQVARLHEVLCFLRAYPDDPEVLERVTRMLVGFSDRRDLRRHAQELADTGTVGTVLRYPYFADTAAWLARRFPRHLDLDWDAIDDGLEQRLLDRLDPLVSYGETPGLDELDLGLRQWLARLKRPDEGDGTFLARGFAAVEADPFLRESYYDELGLPLVLQPGPGTPSRTLAQARLTGLRPFFQRGPLPEGPQDLRAALRRRPRVRSLTRAEGARMIVLAREAMVTRTRDLDVFVYGDPRDVRLLDCGGGLAFAAIGFRPERRLPLEAVYGFLTLKNGVPIGYVLNSALFGSAEIAYNVFETFRGGEAAHVYGWVLACVRHLFGVDAFTIYPYQLGHENEEGLASGAWWFYQKLGFRPRDRRALTLMRSELARKRMRPGHRSTRATLRRLVAHNVYYWLGAPRTDVIGLVSPGRISLAISAYLSRRFGSDRRSGLRLCAREARVRFGLRSQARWTPAERLAWERWAPMLVLLEGVERWTTPEKRAAVAVVRAKGGKRESDFVRSFDGHAKLRAAVLRLAR